MESFEYQARNGNNFYAQIEVQEIYKGRRIYKGLMMYGMGGRSRFGKSYRAAQWYVGMFKNLCLEDSSTDFNPGIKKVKEIIYETES